MIYDQPEAEFDGEGFPVALLARDRERSRVPLLNAQTVQALLADIPRGGDWLTKQDLVYMTRGYYEEVEQNGQTYITHPAATSFHDLKPARGSLINTLTGRADMGTINVGQPLVAIPGAVSPPYWTDPGPLTLTSIGTGSGFIPASLPGQLDFITSADGHPCAQFTSLPGYGDAAGGKRRVQLNSNEITTRIRVAWDLSFQIPDEDEGFRDPVTGYQYGMLLWQFKGGAFPTWALTALCNEDGTYTLVLQFRWSGDPNDSATGVDLRYHFQYFRPQDSSSGTLNAYGNSFRWVEQTFERGAWVDLYIEMFLDERDPYDGFGGKGYCNVFMNGQQVLAFIGPTVQVHDFDGTPPPPHAWSIGIYRPESAVPEANRELNLDHPTNPAPYMRRVLFRRAKLLRLPTI
jgi:hypothetical protein